MEGNKRKSSGLGRSFESLLEDNSPVIGAKASVIRRDEAEQQRRQKENSESLYKKEGAISYVKTPKRSRS